MAERATEGGFLKHTDAGPTGLRVLGRQGALFLSLTSQKTLLGPGPLGKGLREWL